MAEDERPLRTFHRSGRVDMSLEDEVAERHEFLDQMRALGRPVDHATEGRINVEIAERLQDLKKLEELGGEDL